MTPQDELKQKAAFFAAGFIESGMVVGLGTGSTTQFALERLGELIRSGRLIDVVGIPSSVRTETAARSSHPSHRFRNAPVIDVTIDGADEVDPELNLIKGGGGALLREKVLAQATRRNIIIVDESKLAPGWGRNGPCRSRWSLRTAGRGGGSWHPSAPPSRCGRKTAARL